MYSDDRKNDGIVCGGTSVQWTNIQWDSPKGGGYGFWAVKLCLNV